MIAPDRVSADLTLEQSADEPSPLELSILMPCLNEAETIGTCLLKAKDFLARNAVMGEVLVADNGSTDGSIAIAGKLGARVIHVAERGYGAALAGGTAAARGVM
jgi:glycosyltransferase involved in cell wall biosynthesis